MARMGITVTAPDVRAEQTEVSIQDLLDKEPLAEFPARIAVVRVQAPHYESYTARGFGRGNFSVVTTRDVESDEHFARISALPYVDGVAAVNKFVLPERFESEKQLREAAARLHADLLLVYTLDTQFHVADEATAINFVTLGLFPTKNAKVSTTASAALLDTRNGYVYTLAEATESSRQLANAWTSKAAVDQTRLRTETAAFDQLVETFSSSWHELMDRLAVAEHFEAEPSAMR